MWMIVSSDLPTIKAPKDSDITITNRNWHIVVDQYTGYKELEFYSTKSDFVEPICQKFSKWKNNGKLISYIRHNNALKNKILTTIANDSQWRLGIIVECTCMGTPKRN